MVDLMATREDVAGTGGDEIGVSAEHAHRQVRNNVLCNDNDMKIVYKSEVHFNELNPVFGKFQLKFQLVCENDVNRLLRFTIFRKSKKRSYSYKEDSYGFFTTNLDSLVKNPTAYVPLHNWAGKKSKSFVKFHSVLVNNLPNFLQFLSVGWSINLSLAVDFTASNKGFKDGCNLHNFADADKKDEKECNEYEQAISLIG